MRPLLWQRPALRGLAVLAGGLALLLAMSLQVAAQPRKSSHDPEEIKVLQYLLLWSGDFSGQIDGSADMMLQQSVVDYQQKSGFAPNGMIDAAQAKKLLADATVAMQRVGYAYGVDAATRAHVALPRNLLNDPEKATSGSRYLDSDKLVEVETIRIEAGVDASLRQLYRSLLDPLDRSSLVQNVFRGDHFVLAWFSGNNFHIMRFHDRGGEVRGIKVRFDRTQRSAFYPIAVAIVHDYAPFDVPRAFSDLRAPAVSGAIAGERDREPRRGPAGRISISSGSGFVVSTSGHIMTNAHVVQDCASISTSTHKNVKLVGIDRRNDLAILLPQGGIAAVATKVARFAAESVRLGEDVATFGFPLRDILADQLNMTTGIVSSLAGLRGDPKFIQISAPVQRGNSGGPVVDLMGRVIGVVTSKLDALGVAQQSGGDLPQAVNFAVRHEIMISFMRRHGVEPVTAQPGDVMRKTDLASHAAAFTVAVTCERR